MYTTIFRPLSINFTYTRIYYKSIFYHYIHFTHNIYLLKLLSTHHFAQPHRKFNTTAIQQQKLPIITMLLLYFMCAQWIWAINVWLHILSLSPSSIWFGHTMPIYVWVWYVLSMHTEKKEKWFSIDFWLKKRNYWFHWHIWFRMKGIADTLRCI